ncbi:MAG: hypothetical protein HDR09_17680 [Lachnospiraceae bacterium]|nr:hypothetical protein [Lachnospiraceae bacterium]
MKYDWEKVKTALEQNDIVSISKFKTEILGLMKSEALGYVIHGFTYFDVAFHTMASVELRLLNNKNDVLAKFLKALTEQFCHQHSLTIYRDFKSIRPGDKIAEKWKDKGKIIHLNLFDIIKVLDEGFMLSYTHHDLSQGQEREKQINPKDFIFGISRDVNQLKVFLIYPTRIFNDEFDYFDNMEPNFTSFEVVIKNYLDKRAETDQEFAKTYAKPNKSIKECCTYIFSVVEKQRKSGEKCVACSDDEIFGLAMHYYDEDDIVVEKPKAKVKAVVGTEGEQAVKSGEIEVVGNDNNSKPKTRKPRKSKAEVDPNIPEPLEIPIF